MADVSRSSERAKRHIEFWNTDEGRALMLRVFQHDASTEDLLEYALAELWQGMDCMEPMAPSNGLKVDSFHASGCCLRAVSAIIRVSAKLRESCVTE